MKDKLTATILLITQIILIWMLLSIEKNTNILIEQNRQSVKNTEKIINYCLE